LSDTAQLVLRLSALGFVATLVQVAAISQIAVLGTNADLLPLLVAAVGLLSGALPGALFGFAVGLFADTAYATTMGLSSLVLTLVGYLAGRVLELQNPQGAIVPVAVGAGASLVSAGGFGLMNFLLGNETPVSLLLGRQLLASCAVGALLALPVYALVRRVLAGALPDDPRRRRRRATVTPLSVLSQSSSR
jgi:rod shape-determining protein MreD